MANLQAGYGLDRDGYIMSDVGFERLISHTYRAYENLLRSLQRYFHIYCTVFMYMAALQEVKLWFLNRIWTF